ncbi:cytochrome c oxidase assembly protein, partial [Mycobacterium syngnathidarum]|uniref:cytochrome c oxidase assembly protein n=1 Tax=Mycobacterium syngnathidarum TaxID=1908205 RepID=UPI000ABE3711
GRTIAWTVGCAALLITTSSGVRAYGSAMFSVHMGEHMALNMFVPVLLVLGAPVTLALRVLPASPKGEAPGPREWIVWFVHAPVTRFLSHPVTAFVLFVGSLYLVYFTPMFDTLIRYHWGHEFMTVHFLLTGYLYYWGIIGIDPGPRRLPFLGRLGLLFAVMPFHAFFGIATMTMTSSLGESFY